VLPDDPVGLEAAVFLERDYCVSCVTTEDAVRIEPLHGAALDPCSIRMATRNPARCMWAIEPVADMAHTASGGISLRDSLRDVRVDAFPLRKPIPARVLS
jgi:hypothetical protein